MRERTGLVLIIVLAAIVSTLLFIGLSPREPNLPAYERGESKSAEYQAGGSACHPRTLATIRDNRKAFVERKRCAEAAEEHRLKSEDLKQQARSADATEAQTWLNFYLARMALWGTIGGFLTLIAAGLAAFYAREAALASRGSLKAFTEVEKANIIITLEAFQYSAPLVKFDVVANNLGRSGALVTSVGIEWMAARSIDDLRGFMPDITPIIVPASERKTLKTVKIEMPNLKAKNYMWLLVRTDSALVGEWRLRYCFQIFDKPAGSHRLTHIRTRLDEIDGNGRIVSSTDKHS